MEMKFTTEQIHDIGYKYFNYLDSQKSIACLSMTKPERPDMYLTMESDVYTVNRQIYIGCAFPMLRECETEEEVLWMFEYLMQHEILHLYHTPDKAWLYGISVGTRKTFEGVAEVLSDRKWNFYNDRSYSAFSKYLLEEQDIVLIPKQITELCHGIQNSLEDGRIERIGAERSPKFKQQRMIGRERFWLSEAVDNKLDMKKKSNVLNVVVSQILSVATTGKFQRGYIKYYKGTEAEKWYDKIKKPVAAGLYAPTCKKCMEWAIKIEEILTPLIAVAARENTFNEILQQMIDEISAYIGSDNGDRGCRENDEEENNSHSAFDKYCEAAEATEPGDSSDSGESEGSSSKKEEMDASSDRNKSQKGNTPSKVNNSKAGDGESNEVTKEDIQKVMDDLKKAADEAAREAERAKAASDMPKESKTRHVNERKDPPKHGYQKVNEHFKAIGEDGIIFREEERNYPIIDALPYQNNMDAQKFREGIEDIFDRDKAPVMRGQKTGRIQGSHIWMLRAGDQAVYTKKAEDEKKPMAFYMLVDNSGSMGDNEGHSKRYWAWNAASVIEEGIRNEADHVSMKIAAFDSQGWNFVTHIPVKGWEEWQTYSCSYNFFLHGRTGGGNKDGYSIRQATRELLERQEENKYLIVISDGQPTDYANRANCVPDTSEAILEARAMGIHVMGLYISNHLQDEDSEIFKAMYETDYICINPDHLADSLVKVVLHACLI